MLFNELKSIYVRDHLTLVRIYNRKHSNKFLKTIVFLHGSPLDASVLETFASTLAVLHDCTVITYDLRGHGSSSTARSSSSIEEFVTDLEVLLQQLELPYESIILGGWSFGGIIAQAFAQIHYVNALWLIATIGQAVTLPVPDEFLQIAIESAAKADTYPRIPESIIEKNLRRWFWAEDQWNPFHLVVLQGTTAMHLANAIQYIDAVRIIATVDLVPGWKHTQRLPKAIQIIAFREDRVASPERMETTIINPLKAVGHSSVKYHLFDGFHGQIVLQPELIAHALL